MLHANGTTQGSNGHSAPLDFDGVTSKSGAVGIAGDLYRTSGIRLGAVPLHSTAALRRKAEAITLRSPDPIRSTLVRTIDRVTITKAAEWRANPIDKYGGDDAASPGFTTTPCDSPANDGLGSSRGNVRAWRFGEMNVQWIGGLGAPFGTDKGNSHGEEWFAMVGRCSGTDGFSGSSPHVGQTVTTQRGTT